MKIGYTIRFVKEYSTSPVSNSLIDSIIRWDNTIYLNEKELLNQINGILNINYDIELIREKWDINRIKNIERVDYILYDKDFSKFAYWVEKCNIIT
tara:strand:- start:1397 stop:1684 length:288 start_codon:yes stop_codon:yes gene_type:complete